MISLNSRDYADVITQLQTLRADQARRERKRVEHKAIADAYFTQTSTRPIDFDIPSLNRVGGAAEVQDDPAPVETDPVDPAPVETDPAPQTPESQKKESVLEPGKEGKQMSVFAALLKDAVLSTVSEIAAKSPPRGNSAAALTVGQLFVCDSKQPTHPYLILGALAIRPSVHGSAREDVGKNQRRRTKHPAESAATTTSF